MGEELKTTLHRYGVVCHKHLPQSALISKTPLQVMKDWHKPDLSGTTSATFRDVTDKVAGQSTRSISAGRFGLSFVDGRLKLSKATMAGIFAN